jgi:hypothetical protein
MEVTKCYVKIRTKDFFTCEFGAFHGTVGRGPKTKYHICCTLPSWTMHEAMDLHTKKTEHILFARGKNDPCTGATVRRREHRHRSFMSSANTAEHNHSRVSNDDNSWTAIREVELWVEDVLPRASCSGDGLK